MAPILSSLIFNPIYRHTLHTWVGTAFALVAGLQGIVLVLMM
jgi:hypothetical protein